MRYVIMLALLLVSGSAWAESEIVLKTIAMESADQPIEGQTAVAGVIIERSRRSGKSLESVCKTPKQFSCWNDRKWANRWLGAHYDTQTRLNAQKALERAKKAQKRGYTHYHRAGFAPYWAKGRIGVRIGDHIFYAGIR